MERGSGGTWNGERGTGKRLNSHITFMRLALAHAEAAGASGEVPVGAVVVAGRGSSARAQPADRASRSDGARRDRRVAGRRGATGNYRLPGATLYVTVEPCLMCVGAMVHARIDTLVYGAPEPKAGAIESSQRAHEHPALNHRFRVVSGVLAAESAALLQGFFAARRSALASSMG